MQPVMRALQTIAAIESETREVRGEAASTCSSETILSQDLSESSLASSSRNRPTTPSARREATADLNRGSGAPPIA